jgi:glutathione peroxidase
LPGAAQRRDSIRCRRLFAIASPCRIHPYKEITVKTFACVVAAAALLLSVGSAIAADEPAAATGDKVPAALNFKVEDIAGKEVDLSKYQGKVLLIVNTASNCGYTPQYEALEKLHEKYAGQGLAIVGFPCNQFLQQEPGTNAEIAEFCKSNYNVQFDMMGKVDVNGKNASEFYKFLTAEATNPKFAGPIKWNFTKFVIGRNGEVVARYEPSMEPDAPQVVKRLETELGKK